MANAFNEFIIRVYAIDIRRGVEGSKYGQLRVINPAPVMGPIMATSMMGAVFFTWPRNIEQDFAGYRVSAWMSDEFGNIGGTKVFETTSNSYHCGYSETDKNLGLTLANISVTAFDTFEQESYPQTATGMIEGLNIKPTDINGFALKASQMFSTAIALEGEEFYSNTPSPGMVSWNSHRVFIRGVEFQIQAGSTSNKYIYFNSQRNTWPTFEEFNTTDFQHPVVANCSYSSSEQHPADAGLINMDFRGDKYGQIIAVNWQGTCDLAWNAIANQIIGSAYIMDAAINDCHIGNLSAGKITAGSAFIGGVNIGGMTTLDITMGTVGEVPQVPSGLPEGLYITRDFIGYYNGPNANASGTVHDIVNGKGIITIAKGTKLAVGTGTTLLSYVDSMKFSSSDTLRLSVPVVNESGSQTYEFPFSFSEGLKNDLLIELLSDSQIDYSGRFCVLDNGAVITASNEWAYVFKADGTIAVKEGGQIVVGNKNIIMDTKGDTNSIVVAPDGGKAGQSYLEFKDGDAKEYFWNGSTHVQMKSLKNVVVGDCVSGEICYISGDFKVAPTVVLFSPKTMTASSMFSHINHRIVSDPKDVICVGGTKWRFTPKIGIEYIAGQPGVRPLVGMVFNSDGHDSQLLDEVTILANVTAVTVYFHGQIDIDAPLTATKTVSFQLYYKDGLGTWKYSNQYDQTIYNLVLYDMQITVSDANGITAFRLFKVGTPATLPACQFRGGTDAFSYGLTSDHFIENSSTAKYIAFESNT